MIADTLWGVAGWNSEMVDASPWFCKVFWTRRAAGRAAVLSRFYGPMWI
jgi:hypothetical protein